MLPATLFLMTPAASAATLTGDTVTCSEIVAGPFCSLASASKLSFSAVVGPGVEFTVRQGGEMPTTYLSLDFGATDLLITADTDLDSTDPIILDFTDTSKAFPSATLLSSTAETFGAGNISLLGGVLTINMGGTEFLAGQTVDIGLTGPPVSSAPEPSAAGFLSFASIGAVMVRMLRKRSKAALSV